MDGDFSSGIQMEQSVVNWTRCKAVAYKTIDSNQLQFATSDGGDALSQRDYEAAYFRARTAQLIDRFRQSGHFAIDVPCLADVAFGIVPAEMLGKNIMIRFYFSREMALCLVVPLACTIDEGIQMACQKYAKKHLTPTPLSADNFLVKLVGTNVYVANPKVPLHSLYYVRECFFLKRDCCFHLVPSSSMQLPSPQLLHRTSIEMKHLAALPDFELDFATQVIDVLPASMIPHPLELKVTKATYQTDTPSVGSLFFVEVAVIFSGAQLCPPVYTYASHDMNWSQWLRMAMPICDLPRESRLLFTLYEYPSSGRRAAAAARGVDPSSLPKEAIRALGWVHFNVATCFGEIQDGAFEVGMWPGSPNPIACCAANLDKTAIAIAIEMFSHPHPIYWIDDVGSRESASPSLSTTPPPSSDELDLLQYALSLDSLEVLNTSQMELIWKYRVWTMSTHPLAISKVLRAVSWGLRQSVQEAHLLLQSWPSLDPFVALELLGSDYQDTKVRQFAVSCLAAFSDNDLSTVLLQLVQVLKHEQYHSSALSNFLILAAARSLLIAHQLYWYFEAEIHLPNTFFRFRLLKKALLSAVSSEFRERLLLQSGLVRNLTVVATEVKTVDKSQRVPTLVRLLQTRKMNTNCGIPMDPAVDTLNLHLEGCKVMQSFTVPLWLQFHNADRIGRPVLTIFKIGDDLRQDILTLQLLHIMDRLWKENGLNLHLIPYKCVATGASQGFIEVVQNSLTLADIHKKLGGGAIGALKEKVLATWIQQENPTEAEYERAVNLFTLSLAGYSVATYILGIGDRHSDNLMITRQGNLFHIDFAHFLGNTLKFAGIDRETTPFVLTPDFVYVIGGERKEKSDNFRFFTNIATEAYHIARQHGNRLITLLEMMLSTGIPQLTRVQDIYYLKESLKLGESPETADAHFRRQIERSLHNKRSVWMNFWHVVANPE